MVGSLLGLFGLALLRHKAAPDDLYLIRSALADEMRDRGIGSPLLAELEQLAL